MKIISNPHSTPDNFRAYVYDTVILAWEMQLVNIEPSDFNKKALDRDCGIHVLMLKTLNDVQWHDQGTWSKDEFLIFHKNGRGYEGLFKRLRDTFAHGHYASSKRGWIAIRHHYKDRSDNVEKARIFGHLRIGTLKKLITFLGKPIAAEC